MRIRGAFSQARHNEVDSVNFLEYKVLDSGADAQADLVSNRQIGPLKPAILSGPAMTRGSASPVRGDEEDSHGWQNAIPL